MPPDHQPHAPAGDYTAGDAERGVDALAHMPAEPVARPSNPVATLQQLRFMNTVASGVAIADVEELIAEAERFDAFGPFFQPTQWIASHEVNAGIRDVAKSFLAYRKALEPYLKELAARDSSNQP